MANPAYAPRSLGDGDKWGQEVQRDQEGLQREVGLLRDEVKRSTRRRSAMSAQILDLTAEVGRLSEEVRRLTDRLATVEDLARQSELDIRAMRNELRSIDV